MRPLSDFQKKFRLYLSVGWGILMGCLTIALGSSLFSADAMHIPMQMLNCFLFPGLVGSMAINGNVHAFSPAPAAVINVLVNFGILWILCSLVMRIKKPS